MKIEVNKTLLDIDDNIVVRYQKMTGDSESLLPLSCIVLLEAQTGLSTTEALQKFSQGQLESIVKQGMLSELEAFGF